ncbi:hypothetical protein ABZ613_32755 [Streptomyces collinus]|uniref:hypothetical protein n=1 Tax=Streptomyces collinus TaxID=42684 RepID=UPI0033E6F646
MYALICGSVAGRGLGRPSAVAPLKTLDAQMTPIQGASKEEEQRRRTDDGQGAPTGYVGRSARWMVASAREETAVCVLVIGDRWISAGYVDALAEVCGPFPTGVRR